MSFFSLEIFSIIRIFRLMINVNLMFFRFLSFSIVVMFFPSSNEGDDKLN